MKTALAFYGGILALLLGAGLLGMAIAWLNLPG